MPQFYTGDPPAVGECDINALAETIVKRQPLYAKSWINKGPEQRASRATTETGGAIVADWTSGSAIRDILNAIHYAQTLYGPPSYPACRPCHLLCVNPAGVPAGRSFFNRFNVVERQAKCVVEPTDQLTGYMMKMLSTIAIFVAVASSSIQLATSATAADAAASAPASATSKDEGSVDCSKEVWPTFRHRVFEMIMRLRFV